MILTEHIFIINCLIMKAILILLGICIVVAAGYGVYKSTSLMSIGKVPSKEALQQSSDALKQQAEKGLQNAASGAQQVIQSWQKLFDAKKLEAEQYMKAQKEQLKLQAQQKLEEEAKKKIQGVFSGI